MSMKEEIEVDITENDDLSTMIPDIKSETSVNYQSGVPLYKDENGDLSGFYFRNRSEDVSGLYSFVTTMMNVLGVDAHISNDESHVTADEKESWTGGVAMANAHQELFQDMDGSVSNLQGEVEKLSNALYLELTSNPWSCSFYDLDGISRDGGAWDGTNGVITW